MKLTNRLNLPAPLVRAIEADPYNAGDSDITATSLIAPPRIVTLKQRHYEELEEDVADRIYALLGTLGHKVLEEAGKMDGNIVERRFFAERLGWKISAQTDLVLGESTLLTDWKYCSRYVARDGAKTEWVEQLNINHWLAKENGVHVDSMQVVAIYRDWSIRAARREADYPRFPVEIFPIPILPEREFLPWLDERIRLHQSARKMADDAIPVCSAAERWATPDKWAVMKKGNKRAVKLHDDEVAANRHAATDSKLYVEYRPGESVRCMDYCPVVNFCWFGRQATQTLL